MNKEEKCCGDCCWFYGEDTDGWGICALQKGGLDSVNCSDMCQDDFVSRREMRHHMAVLLQWKRYMSDRSELTLYKPVRDDDLHKAQDFSFRYMKVFSKL